MKKIMAIILTFALCFGILSVALAAENEATVPEGYIGIYTAEDLDNIRNDLSGKYILMNNIDLSSYENWNPIGSEDNPFTGELDGNGYVIKNFNLNDEYVDGNIRYVGLFGKISNATVKAVLMEDISVNLIGDSDSKTVYAFGAAAGSASNSTINGCAVSGKINAEYFSRLRVCGIVGSTYFCTLSNCANYADIDIEISNSSTLLKVGGVAADLRYSPLTESCNYGDITISGTDVLKNGEFYIGGIYGDAADNFKNTTHDQNNYNRGTVSVDFSSPRTFIGGIAGQSYSIVNSYNAGEIIYPNNFEGLAGALAGNAFECNLAINMPQRMTNLYYTNEDMTDFSYGERPYVDEEHDIFENIKYLAPEEMKKQESFVGFDFENVWVMEENGYPVLRNLPVIPETEKPGVTKPTTTTEPTTEESTTTPATEENTTTPVATPIEPSTTEPTTEENTTVPVATPIEPSTTETATSEVVTTENTTEPVTNPVTEPSTAEVTTQPVTVTTQPATESTTIPATEPSTTQPVTETESATKPVTDSPATPVEPSTEENTEPVFEPDDDIGVLAWLINVLKAIVNFFVKLFVMLGC